MGFQKQNGSTARNVLRNIVSLSLNTGEVVCYDRQNGIVVAATSSSAPKDVAGIVALPTTLSDIVVNIQPIDYENDYVVNSKYRSNISHNYQRMAFGDRGTIDNTGADIEANGVFMQTDVIGSPEEYKIKGMFIHPYESNSVVVRTTGEAIDTIQDSDGMVITTSTITLTLPTAVGRSGKTYTVKRNYASGDTTVVPTGAETIDSGTSFALTTDGESFGFISDGSNWHIIN